MPSGSLVAGYSERTLPNGSVLKEIVFWERNGLRHGEFLLPIQEEGVYIKNIQFSLDSSLLALHLINEKNKKEKI